MHYSYFFFFMKDRDLILYLVASASKPKRIFDKLSHHTKIQDRKTSKLLLKSRNKA